MHIYKWDDSLRTQHVNVDQDNHEIVRKAQLLSNLITQQAEDKKIKEVAKSLENFVYDHFEKEEMMQMYSHFGNYENHKRSHARFLKGLNRLIHEILSSPHDIELIPKLDRLITETYFNHIKEFDTEAARFIMQRDYYHN